MALATVQAVKDGMLPPMFFHRAAPAVYNAPGHMMNYHYAAGNRPSAVQVAPAPGVAGAAVSAPFTGAFPFTNPASGETLLAQLQLRGASGSVAVGPALLIDRLWHNSGLDRTLTTAQTVNSVTFAARDKNGTADGEGVYIAIEVSTAMGTGVPSVTMSYTNQAGTAGRTASNIIAVVASAPQGAIIVMGLGAGDTGVRSVQSVTFSASWGTSGVLHLVAFRPLCMVENRMPSLGNRARHTAYEDATTLVAPRFHNSSALQLWGEITGNQAINYSGQLALAQG